MKILFVIESIGNGGAERVLLNTIPSLHKKGIHCEVVVLFSDLALLDEFKALNIQLHLLNLRHRWNAIEVLYKLNRVTRENNFDVVHAHLFFAHFYVGLLKKYHRRNIKTVVTLHNMGYEAYPAKSVFKKIRKRADTNMLQSYDLKFAVSKAVRYHFEKELNLKDIELLHNGFPRKDVCRLAALNDLVEFYDSSKINIITPGRLVQEKGHSVLLQIIPLLNEKFNNLQFYFAGEGPLRNEMESIIKHSAIENIVLLGNVQQSELFALIKQADLVVLPSLSEGFPMIVGEAMVLGKAIISTTAGGIPDFIDNEINGILVQPNHPTELHNEISRILNDKELLVQLSINAVNKAKDFDIDTIADKTLNFYNKLIR